MARTQSSKHLYYPQDISRVLESSRADLRTVITSAVPRSRVLRMVSGVMLERQGDPYGRHASAGGEWRVHAAESRHVASLKDTGDA